MRAKRVLSAAIVACLAANALAEMMICDNRSASTNRTVYGYGVTCSTDGDNTIQTTPFKLVKEGWKIEHFSAEPQASGVPGYQFVLTRESK